MTVSILWIDLKQAKLFLFSEERMKRESFQASHFDSTLEESQDGQWSHMEHLSRVGDQQVGAFELFRLFKFFKQVSVSLQSEKKVLILGPGVARHQFYQYLKEKEPEISKRVQTCEDLDDPSDEKIAAYAMSHFKQ